MTSGTAMAPTSASAFAFRFRIEEGEPEDPGSLDPQTTSTVSTEQGEVGSSAINDENADDEDEAQEPGHPTRAPFAWIPPSEALELWVRRREADIPYQPAAIGGGGQHRRNSSTCEIANGTNCRERETPDDEDQLRHVVKLRATDDEDDEDEHVAASVVNPGVYEGGGAVWECSLDLVEYLSDGDGLTLEDHLFLRDADDEGDQDATTTFVLELGCGHALPSCWLLRRSLVRKAVAAPIEEGPTATTEKELRLALVDFNRSVVENVTLPNVILNTSGLGVDAEELVGRRVALGYGDWLDLSRHLRRLPQQSAEGNATSDDYASPVSDQEFMSHLPHDGRFHLILAAETLYTPKAAAETALFVQRHLRHDGVALIASKRYYFGVGGGVDDFRDALLRVDSGNEWDAKSVREVDTGVGNIREILRVTRRRQ